MKKLLLGLLSLNSLTVFAGYDCKVFQRGELIEQIRSTNTVGSGVRARVTDEISFGYYQANTGLGDLPSLSLSLVDESGNRVTSQIIGSLSDLERKLEIRDESLDLTVQCKSL